MKIRLILNLDATDVSIMNTSQLYREKQPCYAYTVFVLSIDKSCTKNCSYEFSGNFNTEVIAVW